MMSAESAEDFYKIGISRHGAKARFAYGKKKIIDSDLPFAEKIKRVLGGEEFLSDTPYDIEIIHEVYSTMRARPALWREIF